ncbi:hypothetical protein GAR06_03833 [Micromonospora saelicesensis]|nr:hypothetical protein GAR06_03833 [Micromonospora saelicesensis]
MRPGDTESHRHPPQPARTPRCSRTPPSRPAGSPRWLHAGRLATTTLAIARFRHNPRDLGQFPFTRNGNCPRSAGSHQPDRAIRLRRRASRSGDAPSGSGDPAMCLRRAPAGIVASAPSGHPALRHLPQRAPAGIASAPSGHSPVSRHPPPAGTRRRGIRPGRAPGGAASAPSRRRDVRDQRPGPAARKRKCRWPAPRVGVPASGRCRLGLAVRWCGDAVAVMRWCWRAWFCGSAVVWVSCSSAGRPGRWPAAPTGRRRPGRPTPARSARRRSAPCPATRRPASDP